MYFLNWVKEEKFDWPIINEMQCMDLYGRGVKKSHFVRIIQSLKYSLFEVVDQHLCGTQNLVQIGPRISEEMRG